MPAKKPTRKTKATTTKKRSTSKATTTAKKGAKSTVKRSTKASDKSTSKKTTGAQRSSSESLHNPAQYFTDAFKGPSAQTDNVLQFGANAMQDFFSGGAGETQKAQEKAFAIGRDTAQQFTSTADSATRSLGDVIANGRDSFEACLESGNIATNMGKVLSKEIFEYANSAFSDNVELSQEVFSCRTVSDAFDLQNKLVKTNIDNFLSESMRISEMLFRFASEASEPFNERIANASKRFVA